MGSGSSFTIVALSKLQGEAIGKYNASLHLGLTVGSMISIYVYSIWNGNEAFLLYAATGLMGALVVAFFVKEPLNDNEGLKKDPINYSRIFQALKEIRRPAIHTGIFLYGELMGYLLLLYLEFF